jgi:hypothetical protein
VCASGPSDAARLEREAPSGSPAGKALVASLRASFEAALARESRVMRTGWGDLTMCDAVVAALHAGPGGEGACGQRCPRV